ncbi:TrbI/VirB10 family protein [Phenylobacterium deserti]|uniref:Type VI secretion protein n=1 Tax=Phenylobacterium deserti TaxID=1914756 RepID=A0A328AC49_9CAUL|nr:TrbI/VirB10 family protein [Phenylobacterium deserti]RAK52185.1 type VI secretion protein [Phenylobacterium deserti]
MRENLRRYERLAPDAETDPRQTQGAEVISLATRSVMPAVTQRKGGSDALGVAAGVAVVGMLGAVTLLGLNHSRQNGAPPQPAAAQPGVPQPEPLQQAPAVPPQAITIPAPAAPAPQPVLAAPPNTQLATAPASNPLATPTVIFDASALPAPTAAAATAGATPSAGSNDEFAARVGGVGGTTAVATAGINPQTTVTQGTLIPAVLETAIDTDVPGYVRAVVSADVRSFDGSRVLIPRSSRLIGQYKSGLQAGQKRAYVIWSRVIRPDGVSVNIASPATSYAGETGLSGRVDNHFFQRFGSAMLLSVVGGLATLGNSGGTAVVIGSQGQSAAAAAVGQSGQIGPTVRVRQGEPIRVFTARDLDFSRVAAE